MQNAPRRSLRERLVLTGEIIEGYVRARRALRRGDVRSALRVLRENGSGDASLSVEDATRLGGAVRRAFVLLPSRSRCLMQSLVLTRMLARRRTPSSLVIGVRPGERFGAHAWVELGGHPLLPPGGVHFARLVEL